MALQSCELAGAVLGVGAGAAVAVAELRRDVLSRANCMHSDAASQGGGGWQGCGAAYLLLAEGSGRIHGSGRIESVHPEWGPIDKGAPIDDGWIPDVTDKLTFDLCLGWLLMTVVAKG